jgi:hypothetical protein
MGANIWPTGTRQEQTMVRASELSTRCDPEIADDAAFRSERPCFTLNDCSSCEIEPYTGKGIGPEVAIEPAEVLLCFDSLLRTLHPHGGAGGAVGTRRHLFPSRAIASMPQAPTPPVPPADITLLSDISDGRTERRLTSRTLAIRSREPWPAAQRS